MTVNDRPAVRGESERKGESDKKEVGTDATRH